MHKSGTISKIILENGFTHTTVCKTDPQKTGSTSSLISQKGCASLLFAWIRDGKPVPYIWCSKVGCLPAYFRLSSTATARSTVIPTMGEQCKALRVEIAATCRWQVATLPMGAEVFRFDYFWDSSTATATETVIPTMGLLPAPRKPIISTWAGTEEEPANWASECIRPMVSVMP